MPMVDVYVAEGVLPAESHVELRTGLAHAVLRAEGAPLMSPFLENTGVFIHEMPESAIGTGAPGATPVVRLHVTTPPAALTRASQKRLVEEATELVAAATGDPGTAARTWVTLTEAAEGGWGVAGLALGREDFAALRTRR